jgi:tetratricopeptide (TPR) repeat protein
MVSHQHDPPAYPRGSLANFLARSGDYDGARTELERVLAVDPDSADAIALHGDVLMAIGEQASAHNAHDDAESAYRRALADYDRLAAVVPDHPAVLFSRARAYVELGDVDAAIGDLERALELDPDDADAHNRLGVLLEGRGSFAEALEHYERVVALAPDNPVGWRNRGDALRALGRADAAATSYRRAVELDPDEASTRIALAEFLGVSGDYDGARTELERVLAVDPDSADAIALDASVLMAIGDRAQASERAADAEAAYSQALAGHDRLVSMFPDDPGVLVARASAHAQLGDVDAAVADLNRALEIDPNHIDALIERGYVRMGQGQDHRALWDFERAARRPERIADAYVGQAAAQLNLEASYEAEGLNGRAWQCANRALAALGSATAAGELQDPVQARWLRGRALVALEAYDTAVEALSAALDAAQADDLRGWQMRYERAQATQQWGRVAGDRELRASAVADLLELARAGADPADRATAGAAAGAALIELGRHGEATERLTAAIEEHGDYPWACEQLVLSRWFRHEYEQAASALERALELQPDGPSTDAKVAGILLAERVPDRLSWGSASDTLDGLDSNEHLQRAYSLTRFAVLDRAEAHLRRAVARDPDSADAHNALAWFLVDKDPTPTRIAEAIELGSEAVRLETETWARGNCLDTLGWAHFLAGDLRSALRELEKANELTPHALEIRLHLAEARVRRDEDGGPTNAVISASG